MIFALAFNKNIQKKVVKKKIYLDDFYFVFLIFFRIILKKELL